MIFLGIAIMIIGVVIAIIDLQFLRSMKMKSAAEYFPELFLAISAGIIAAIFVFLGLCTTICALFSWKIALAVLLTPVILFAFFWLWIYSAVEKT